MYSRKTGVLYNESEVQKKINNFNKELREQYRRHNTTAVTPTAVESTDKAEKDNLKATMDLLTNENVIIIGIILLLLTQENKDYLLIGALAALLFLSR